VSPLCIGPQSLAFKFFKSTFLLVLVFVANILQSYLSFPIQLCRALSAIPVNHQKLTEMLDVVALFHDPKVNFLSPIRVIFCEEFFVAEAVMDYSLSTWIANI